MTMHVLGILLPSLLLGLFALVMVLVFPILALVHCVRNSQINTGGKVAWVLLILFTWTIGASFYGVISSGRPLFKTLGVMGLCLLAGALIFKKPLTEYSARSTARTALASLDRAWLVDVTEADRVKIKTQAASLDLSNEANRDLLQLLAVLLRNGKLDKTAVATWAHYYAGKDVPTDTELKRHILKLQTASLVHH